MTPENLRQLRDAFGSFMTGVTVVTAMDTEGKPLGFTANSFASVSLDPPLLLVSIAKTSANFATMTAGRGFCVNILSEGQKTLSNTFARRVEDRFAQVEWQRGPFGSPVLADVSAWFDCSIEQVVDAGDHAILIGRVEAYQSQGTPGLGYYRGAYITAKNEAEAIMAGPDVVITAIVESEGRVLLIDDGRGGLALPCRKVSREGARATLAALIEAHGVPAVPGFIYSLFEDDVTHRQHIAFLCHAAPDPRLTELSHSTLTDIADPAVVTMLERLVAEAQLGNYGIYFGNQNAGEVRRIAGGREE